LLAEYLRENRIVPEKNDLHSILFLLTPGVESSKAGTLLSWLVTFKRLHDENARLQDVIPDFVRRRPQRYHGLGLRDLCGEMHAFYRDSDVSRLQREQFEAAHLPEQAMAPHEAARMLVRNKVDYLPIDRIAGRIAATLMLVYPPGIATVVPGERLGGRAEPMTDYLLAFERAENMFPGLGTEIQGVYREVAGDGAVRFHTYVVRE
jgi:arginine/lysine/ornithine decarboxylase